MFLLHRRLSGVDGFADTAELGGRREQKELIKTLEKEKKKHASLLWPVKLNTPEEGNGSLARFSVSVQTSTKCTV